MPTVICDTYTGLIAEWYDDWLSRRKEDVAYYLEAFQGHSGSAFDSRSETSSDMSAWPIQQSGRRQGREVSAFLAVLIICHGVSVSQLT